MKREGAPNGEVRAHRLPGPNDDLDHIVHVHQATLEDDTLSPTDEDRLAQQAEALLIKEVSELPELGGRALKSSGVEVDLAA